MKRNILNFQSEPLLSTLDNWAKDDSLVLVEVRIRVGRICLFNIVVKENKLSSVRSGMQQI